MSLVAMVTSQEILFAGWFKQASCVDLSKLLIDWLNNC